MRIRWFIPKLQIKSVLFEADDEEEEEADMEEE
jgi:hypothetical protein